MKMPVLIATLLLAAGALAQPEEPLILDGQVPVPESRWAEAESLYLTHAVQLTTPERFIKAGESYFSPDGSHIIFQAIPRPANGATPEQFYQMFVAKVKRDAEGRITGLEEAIRLSPEGSANTCGWFHPTQNGLVLMGSTIVPPAMKDVPGYQRTTGRYVWQFHSEMKIVLGTYHDDASKVGEFELTNRTVAPLQPLIAQEGGGYTAECSWSKDGRYILYAAYNRERSEKLGRNHLDIMLYDGKTQRTIPLVTADGYNGGPFFSPDGKKICYRSDRKGDDRLQIFTADLTFDADGVPTGIENEVQQTQDEHVNWGPFWDPSGQFLVYASSRMGHDNYEVFQLYVYDGMSQTTGPLPIRITYARGADVLPAFSPDGKWIIWTAQRGTPLPGEQKPSSQLWAAEFHPGKFPGPTSK